MYSTVSEILLKLKAYLKLLQTYPNFVQNIVFFLVFVILHELSKNMVLPLKKITHEVAES